MNYSVVMAGFGGQGVLMMGDLLAYCGMKSGLNVTWMPAYGVEMRGGAANCTVVLSDEEIGAPIVGSPQAVIAMSEPAFLKFKERLSPQGLLMANSSLISQGEEETKAEQTEALFIPALELAEESGDAKMANLTMLGAFLTHTKLLEIDQVTDLVESFLPAGKKRLIPGIAKALQAGKAFMESR